MSAASDGSVDSDSGINASLAIIATRTDGVVGVRIMRVHPDIRAIAKMANDMVAETFQSMFHRRRYHATASPDGNSDMMNITPHMPGHHAVCSSEMESTCEYTAT